MSTVLLFDPVNSPALSAPFQGGQKGTSAGHHDRHGPSKEIPRSFARLVITVLTVGAFISSTGTGSVECTLDVDH